MFENALLNKSRSRAPALVISYILQVMLLGVLVVVPLLHIEALPTWWLTPPVVPPPSGGSAAHSVATRRAASSRHTDWRKLLLQPASIPTTIAQLNEKPLAPQEGAADGPYIPGAIPGDGPPGVPGGLGPNSNWFVQAPPPPQPKPANTPPVRVGGDVIAAKLVYHPDPEFPALAKAARIQGTVVLEAIIGKDGTIQELKVLSGPAMLVRAAVDAVQRWRYQPTLLNRVPVEVLTEISVRFTLAE